MPKIIKNVREQLLEEARRQINDVGYRQTTIRSVAGACGLGVGTVYNYFKSKEMLVASFILEDWMICLEKMRNDCKKKPDNCIHIVYVSIQGFIDAHKKLFSDDAAVADFNASVVIRHVSLRNQIVEIITPLITSTSIENKTLLAEFLAESILTWTSAGTPYEDIYPIFNKLIDK